MYNNGKIKCSIDGDVAVITIDNPPANAIDNDVIKGLEECFALLYEEWGLRAVILTGTGKFFAAGADIKEFQAWNPELSERLTRKGQLLFSRIEQYPTPVIAAINGFALGGGLELALACDIRYAEETAKLGLPEVSLGIIPGYGGTQRLSRAIGPGKAKELIFTAGSLRAEDALACGLVQKVTTPEMLMEEVTALAARIADNGPLAVRQAKECINVGRDLALDKGLEREAVGARACFESEDRNEGIAAFLGKRRPVFKNK